ncbi:hypothetical protein WJX84_010797 [Apatococcus fuscideae]|uniref:Uncharacterized protein n=1 Tax=Apatococcus fuscideae TaxID=2026836 RepID=A0AAW1TKZ4_9CHLO
MPAAEQSISGHNIMLDTRRSELYCSCCQDYRYDQAFDTVLLGANVAARSGVGTSLGGVPEVLADSVAIVRKRKRSPEGVEHYRTANFVMGGTVRASGYGVGTEIGRSAGARG